MSYCFLKSTNLFEVPVNKQFYTKNRSCDFDHQKQFIFWVLICFFFSHHELELSRVMQAAVCIILCYGW